VSVDVTVTGATGAIGPETARGPVIGDVTATGHVTGGEGETGMDLGTVTGAVTDLATGIVVGGERKREGGRQREKKRESIFGNVFHVCV
jgi:hypothetical protein